MRNSLCMQEPPTRLYLQPRGTDRNGRPITASTTPCPKYWLLKDGAKVYKANEPVIKEGANSGKEGHQSEQVKTPFSLLFHMSKTTETGYSIFDRQYEGHLLAALPDNFCWILRYVSAVLDCRPMEVYSNMAAVEEWLLKSDPKIFGEIIVGNGRTDRWWSSLVV